jgi:hypothetical protein
MEEFNSINVKYVNHKKQKVINMEITTKYDINQKVWFLDKEINQIRQLAISRVLIDNGSMMEIFGGPFIVQKPIVNYYVGFQTKPFSEEELFENIDDLKKTLLNKVEDLFNPENNFYLKHGNQNKI